MTSEPNHRWQFLKAVLRQPTIVGAIAPSSTGVATAVVPDAGSPVVVELGPGTGSVTDAIAARLPAGGRHLAVEVDGELLKYLRRTRPHVETLWGDAGDLKALLASAEVDRVDAVVCALPWSLIGGSDRLLAFILNARLGPVNAVISGGIIDQQHCPSVAGWCRSPSIPETIPRSLFARFRAPPGMTEGLASPPRVKVTAGPADWTILLEKAIDSTPGCPVLA